MKPDRLLPKSARRAAIYLRVSTGMQAQDGISLDAQQRLDREYAEREGYTIEERHVYVEAHTGGELFERPQLGRLLAAARSGDFHAVIVDCLDRWVRDADFDGWLKIELQRVGVRVLFATEEYGSDLAGRVQRSLKGQFAQEERLKLSQRCRKAYFERLEQGRSPAMGPAPYGYLPDKQWIETKRGPVFKATGDLLVNEEEAAIVRRIFALLIEGWSLRSIGRRLDEEGIAPPSGSAAKRYAIRAGAWGVSTLSGIIRDPVYRGERAARRQRSLAVDQEAQLDRAERGLQARVKKIALPEQDWVFLPAPALVSPAEWHAAQVVLNRRGGVFHTRNTETTERRIAHPALLRGRVTCAQCGRRLCPEWQQSGRLIYRCVSKNDPAGRCGAGNLDGHAIEAWAQRVIADFLGDPDVIDREVSDRARRDAARDLEAELEEQYRRQMIVQRKQERLLSLFAGAAEGELPVDLVQKQLADAERERRDLETIIEALKASQRQRQASTEQARLLKLYVGRVARRLSTGTFDDWRRALAALDIAVKATPKTWELWANLDPDAPHGEGIVFIASSTNEHSDILRLCLGSRRMP